MAKLVSRPHDVQALKAIISAEVAEIPYTHDTSSDVPADIFGNKGVALHLPDDKGVLTEPNAIATYLGELFVTFDAMSTPHCKLKPTHKL